MSQQDQDTITNEDSQRSVLSADKWFLFNVLSLISVILIVHNLIVTVIVYREEVRDFNYEYPYIRFYFLTLQLVCIYAVYYPFKMWMSKYEIQILLSFMMAISNAIYFGISASNTSVYIAVIHSLLTSSVTLCIVGAMTISVTQLNLINVSVLLFTTIIAFSMFAGASVSAGTYMDYTLFNVTGLVQSTFMIFVYCAVLGLINLKTIARVDRKDADCIVSVVALFTMSLALNMEAYMDMMNIGRQKN